MNDTADEIIDLLHQRLPKFDAWNPSVASSELQLMLSVALARAQVLAQRRAIDTLVVHHNPSICRDIVEYQHFPRPHDRNLSYLYGIQPADLNVTGDIPRVRQMGEDNVRNPILQECIASCTSPFDGSINPVIED
jgi:hypothetical protein